MFNFLNPIKSYLAAAVTAVVAILAAMYKYRGSKIEELESVVEAKDKELEVAAKVVKQEKKVAKFVADNMVAKAEAEHEEDDKHYTPGERFYI